MARLNEKFTAALTRLERLQAGGRRVFRSGEFARADRERLVMAGFLNKVAKGWLISSSPDVAPGDTTPWFSCFWEFCAAYCTVRFGEAWALSPEQSVRFHGENASIPKRVVIHALKGNNNAIELPFGTSLYDLKQREIPGGTELTVRDGLRLYTPEAALVRIAAAFFVDNPAEARTVLSGIRDVAEISRQLLDGGRSSVAGRLAGAFRRIGRDAVADEIRVVMQHAGYDVRESDPFAPSPAFGFLDGAQAPIVGRLQFLWETFRKPVITAFPEAPGLPRNRQAYLSSVDDAYRSDAYHSLSIEGYRVTPVLIEEVRGGDWNPERAGEDQRNRDALAARGYWQAFQLVRETVGAVTGGADPVALVRTAHQDWYRALFQPSVAGGLIADSALVGYRNGPVFLRGSRHVPPRREEVLDAMPALFDLLENEAEPSVRAVLGHWLAGYIHPYPDGNGRMARFMMNVMLASGGYPWTVIRVEDRDAYMAALKEASVAQRVEPFARFVADRVRRSMERP